MLDIIIQNIHNNDICFDLIIKSRLLNRTYYKTYNNLYKQYYKRSKHVISSYRMRNNVYTDHVICIRILTHYKTIKHGIHSYISNDLLHNTSYSDIVEYNTGVLVKSYEC
jgi:hypothetical protein